MMETYKSTIMMFMISQSQSYTINKASGDQNERSSQNYRPTQLSNLTACRGTCTGNCGGGVRACVCMRAIHASTDKCDETLDGKQTHTPN